MSGQGKHFPIHPDEARSVGLAKACVPLKIYSVPDQRKLVSTCPPLLCIYWQFNVKVAAAHHPIIQKEVDELLAKGVIEPSSGGAGFYSSMFVVPKHIGCL